MQSVRAGDLIEAVEEEETMAEDGGGEAGVLGVLVFFFCLGLVCFVHFFFSFIGLVVFGLSFGFLGFG